MSLTQEEIDALPAICVHEPTKGHFVQRRIVSAANRFGTITVLPSRVEAYDLESNEIPLVIASARHYSPVMGFVIDEINRLKKLVGEPPLPFAYGNDQGFIDQWDQYVTREEGFIIAEHSRQLNATRNAIIIQGELFSENIY